MQTPCAAWIMKEKHSAFSIMRERWLQAIPLHALFQIMKVPLCFQFSGSFIRNRCWIMFLKFAEMITFFLFQSVDMMNCVVGFQMPHQPCLSEPIRCVMAHSTFRRLNSLKSCYELPHLCPQGNGPSHIQSDEFRQKCHSHSIEGKTLFSTNSPEKTEYLHAKIIINLDPYLTPYTKINSK